MDQKRTENLYPHIDPERLPHVRMYFRFYGETFDPDQITSRLGIEPTTSFRPGDPITKDGQGIRRGYGWMLKVEGTDPFEIDGLLQEFRRQVPVSAETVRQLCRDLSVNLVIVCGVGIRDLEVSAPDLYLPSEFLNWVSDLGASLHVDIV